MFSNMKIISKNLFYSFKFYWIFSIRHCVQPTTCSYWLYCINFDILHKDIFGVDFLEREKNVTSTWHIAFLCSTIPPSLSRPQAITTRELDGSQVQMIGWITKEWMLYVQKGPLIDQDIHSKCENISMFMRHKISHSMHASTSEKGYSNWDYMFNANLLGWIQ